MVGGKSTPFLKRAWNCAPASPEWVFYEGPPTANGKPGVHHVLARVFKDIYPRYKTMRGYYVGRKAGWDCHGLPVELEIEKRLGFDRKEQIEEYGVAEFNRQCRESVTAYVDDWNRMTERIGMWLDLSDPYMTMTDELHRVGVVDPLGVRQAGPALRGLQGGAVLPAVRDGAVVARGGLWATSMVTDPSVFVRFPLAVRRHRAGRDGLHGEPAGLDHDALDPDLQRGRGCGRRHRVRAGPAGRRAPDPGRRPGVRSPGARGGGGGDLPGLAPGGARLQGAVRLRHSRQAGLAGRRRPTSWPPTRVPASCTSPLPSAPTTWPVGQANDLPVIMPVDAEGRFTAEITPWAGVFVKDADAGIMDELESRGLLFARQPYEHNYPLLLALRHAPHLLREVFVVRPYHRPQGRGAGRQRGGHLVSRPPQARPFRQVAGEQHRLVALARPLLGHAAAGVALRERPRHGRRLAGAARRTDRPRSLALELHRPYVDEVTFACPECGAEAKPRGVGHRRLVRLRLHAGGAVALSLREPGAVARSASQPTSSAKPSTRPAAGSTACSPSAPC